MSYLAVQIESYFAANPDITMLSLEASAGLKRGTIDSIRRNAHPRPERFGALLKAVDDTTARRWLTAYLRDDCPPDFLPRLEIIIRDLENNVQEPPTTYGPQPLETGPVAVLAVWHRLQAAIQSDTSLGRWFVKTVNLILGPE